MRLIINGGIHDWRIFIWEDVGSKPHSVVCVLGEIQYEITVRVSCRVAVCGVQALTVFRISLSCQVKELVLVSDVL